MFWRRSCGSGSVRRGGRESGGRPQAMIPGPRLLAADYWVGTVGSLGALGAGGAPAPPGIEGSEVAGVSAGSVSRIDAGSPPPARMVSVMLVIMNAPARIAVGRVSG